MLKKAIATIFNANISCHQLYNYMSIVTINPKQKEPYKVLLKFCKNAVTSKPFSCFDNVEGITKGKNVKCVFDAKSPKTFHFENDTNLPDSEAEELVLKAIVHFYYTCRDSLPDSKAWFISGD